MSRFLKTRHYKLVLPGIDHLIHLDGPALTKCIEIYMNQTDVSYTEQDVAEIQTMYLARYGQSHTPNAHNLHGEEL